MNPLTSVKGTIISSFVLAIIVAWYVSPENSSLVQRNLSVWLHALFGVTWIGLLYYFNFEPSILNNSTFPMFLIK